MEQLTKQPTKHRHRQLRKTLVTDASTPTTDTLLPIKHRRSRPRKYLPIDVLVYLLEVIFKNSHHNKINRLLKKGTFEPINV
jgi:hypothetical protein